MSSVLDADTETAEVADETSRSTTVALLVLDAVGVVAEPSEAPEGRITQLGQRDLGLQRLASLPAAWRASAAKRTGDE
jgi:hypothetical protein